MIPPPFIPAHMQLLLDSDDQETLQSIGEDTIQAIVALCVESILWSESITLLLPLLVTVLTYAQQSISFLSSFRLIFFCMSSNCSSYYRSRF